MSHRVRLCHSNLSVPCHPRWRLLKVGWCAGPERFVTCEVGNQFVQFLEVTLHLRNFLSWWCSRRCFTVSLRTLHAHYTTDKKSPLYTARCHTECGYATVCRPSVLTVRYVFTRRSRTMSVWATSVVEMLLYCHTYAAWKSSLQHRKLKDHLVCYGGVKLYVCSNCPKSFYTAGELKHHQPVHSTVKQFNAVKCRPTNLYQNLSMDYQRLWHT